MNSIPAINETVRCACRYVFRYEIPAEGSRSSRIPCYPHPISITSPISPPGAMKIRSNYDALLSLSLRKLSFRNCSKKRNLVVRAVKRRSYLLIISFIVTRLHRYSTYLSLSTPNLPQPPVRASSAEIFPFQAPWIDT